MSAPQLQIGPLTIPALARVDQLSQSYEPIGGQSIFRAATGRGINQMTWQKTRIVTSGGGWIPAGLQALDYTQHMILRCIVPLSINLPPATLTGTLQPQRRADHAPWAQAVMPGGGMVQVPLAIAGDEATLGAPVEGALGYRISWLPEFSVIALACKFALRNKRFEHFFIDQRICFVEILPAF